MGLNVDSKCKSTPSVDSSDDDDEKYQINPFTNAASIVQHKSFIHYTTPSHPNQHSIDNMPNIQPSKTKKSKNEKRRNSKRSFKKSKLKLFGVRAKLKLTKTESSTAPNRIIEAKAQLKGIKHLSLDLEQITNKLYESQMKQHKLSNDFSDQLNAVKARHKDEIFPIYLKNIVQIFKEAESEYHQYLVNMKQTLNDLNAFNNGSIQQCKKLKLKLKAKKAAYDMSINHENKLKKAQNKQKKVNLSDVHCAQSKSKKKYEKLELLRNEFITSVKSMETEKLSLLSSMKQYMGSYTSYYQTLAFKLKDEGKQMMNHSKAEYLSDSEGRNRSK